MDNIELSHVTIADPDLVHQVVFKMVAGRPGVSCNCRRRAPMSENSTTGERSHEAVIVEGTGLQPCRDWYNNPDNHYAPFDPEEDRAKW